MERDICPIAVLYFAVMRSIFNILKLLVNMSTNFTTHCRHFVSRDIIGHVTIRSTVDGFL